MSVPNLLATRQYAQVALARGEFSLAIATCREVLGHNARDFESRYLLALGLALAGEPDAAIEQWRHVLRQYPRHFAAQLNLGVALSQRGENRAAIVELRAAAMLDPAQAEVHYSLGNCLLAVSDVEGAITALREAVTRNPRWAQARNNLGVAYRRLGRIDEACTEFRVAISFDPAYVDAHSNLGAALQAQGQHDAAVDAFRRAVQLDPLCMEAVLGQSQSLEQLNRRDESIAVLSCAAVISPDAAGIHRALGVALHRSGQLSAALASYQRALWIEPGAHATWRDKGRALEGLQQLSQALESYRQAERLAPHDAGTVGGLLSDMIGCCVRACDWTAAAESLQRLHALPDGIEALYPFLALGLCEEPAEQLRVSRARSVAVSVTAIAPRSPATPHERIRIAYVSSDLREHPVGHLMARILERHQRSSFEVHAVSLQPCSEDSEVRRRLLAAVDHYHDVSAISDLDAARKLRALGIDIAVDLNGYTTGCRHGIFAHRAAPVQVNFLGYAGTLGVPYMDYILADEVVIPPGEERHYSEQVVRLPYRYLPHDDRRELAAKPSRSEAGLPGEGFVFCAFTNAYKITPPG